MTKFALIRDINGYNGFGLKFCENKYSTIMPTSSAISLTVPHDYEKWLAIFSYEAGSNVWVANNETAEGPAGATLVATTSERNPVAREVKAGDVLSFFTSDTGVELGVTLYGL